MKEEDTGMGGQIIKDYQLISINQLVRAIKEGRENSERFCFIIGSGASVSSGIPTGTTLEYQWMKEMEESLGLEGIRGVAKSLKGHLDHDYAKIEADWEETKKSGSPLPCEYYFDIYKLRFFPNNRNGYHYLERIMADKHPGFGYHPLALMLTDGSGSNLVITTNYDSMIEDALFLYTNEKPLVINHEFLAEYAGDPNIKRPIIAKVHGGIFFDPLNQPGVTNEFEGKWHDVLAYVFKSYTPIVIGYGGGDNRLMKLLEDSNIKMKNGMYWCFYEKDGLPNDKIQTLIEKKNGYLVRTAGFDAAMLAIGNALFPNKIGVHEAEEYLNNRTNMQIANYEKEYKRLTEQESLNDKKNTNNQISQSESDFKTEIEKMVERANVTEKERAKRNQMTAWDYRRQGDRYRNLKQYENAVVSYSKAIHMQSNIAQFYNDRGYAYNDLEEYDKTITDCGKAIELNPKYADAYNNRGNAYHSLGQYDRAITDYNNAIELNPENAIFYYNRGSVYDDLGGYDKAIKEYNKAVELDPEDANFYYKRGIAYKSLGEYDRAIKDYDKAVELNPKDADFYYNRGNVYNDLGEYDKAIKDYDKAIKLNPEDADFYNNRGNAYDDLGEYDRAITDYDEAVELKPEDAKFYYNRGIAYDDLGEYDKAIADYDKAIELKPENADFYNNRGLAYKNLGQYNRAITNYDKAVELKPEDAIFYNNRAFAYKNLGEYDRAITDYNKAIELDFEYKNAYANRAEVYRLMGETAKAEADEAMVAKL